jgi:hypothetical protein
MNKRDEYVCVEAVYEKLKGGNAVRFMHSESPDYLCQKRGETVFGVEVTEVYQDEGAARLANIKGYSTELLSKKAYRHKDDKKYLLVQKVGFPAKDGGKEVELDGLVQFLPPFAERAELLIKTISRKERKFDSYRKQAGLVDLIIYDRGGLFSFSDFPKFFPAFSHAIGRTRVVGSSFREIFLLIRNISGAVIRVPLKLNIVAAEIFAFETLIVRSRFAQSKGDNVRNLFYLVRALDLAGFGSLRALIEGGTFCFAWGSWVWGYDRGGKKIRDMTLDNSLVMRGEALGTAAPLSEFSGEERAFLHAIAKKRSKVATCIPLVFETSVPEE